MRAFVSHETALAYWRQHFQLDSEIGNPAHASTAEAVAHRKAEVLGSIPEEFVIPGKPADILVFESTQRRYSNNVACHLWTTVVPEGAFNRVGDVYISSPEFMFLQMASKLSVIELVALGCELCGYYVLLPQNCTHPGAIDGMPKRLYPLTTIEKLAAFVDAAEKARGRNTAQRALKYVVEGLRSPMETMTYMLLCMPALLGGYGIPKPVMNDTIELDEEGRSIARRRYCEGDLCWHDHDLDLEYHGEVHVGAAQMKSDVGRTLAIEHMGIKVITVTSPQVLDADEFELVAKEVAKQVRKRLHPRVLGSSAARLNLHWELERWMGLK